MAILVGCTSLAACALSLWIAFRTAGSARLPGCAPGSGCAALAATRWSRWAGLPVAAPGAALYFLLASTGTSSLGLFVLLTGVILTFYGGGFATIPAYLKDLFGTLEVGAIHGRLLTAWSCAGVAGPLIVNGLADYQTGRGEEGSGLYTLSLFIMVGVLVVGFIANLLIRPVDPRFHEGASEERSERSRTATAGSPAVAAGRR